MNNKRANQLQQALEQAARGEMAEGPIDPLVRTAQQLSVLGDPPPPAPYKLAPSRQRYMAQVAVIRGRKASRKRAFWPSLGAAKLVSGLTVAVLLLSLFLGAGQAMADSLPGEALYGLKLGVVEQRLRWTSDPEARLDLALAAVDARLSEIAQAIETGQAIDQETNARLQEHLGLALGTVDQEIDPLQTQHQATVQAWEQRVLKAMWGLTDAEHEPLRLLAQETRRLRFELHAGKALMAGERDMNRTGQPDAPDAEETGEGDVEVQAVDDGRPDFVHTFSQPEEPPTGANAPAYVGPGPGQLGSDEKNGEGPVLARPTPSGPTYNWLRKNSSDSSNNAYQLYQPEGSGTGTGSGTGGSGQKKP